MAQPHDSRAYELRENISVAAPHNYLENIFESRNDHLCLDRGAGQ